MTIFGWDMSHYDWDRGLTASEIRAAAGAGIAFMTHKIGEGTGYTDPRFDDFWRATRGLPTLLGAYYVNHPGDQQTQSDRFLALLDSQAPGWRNAPFILQVDAEKFDYMPREPNLTEIRAFVARLVARAPQHRPIVYAPRWLYGDRLRGLGSPLWASNYGSNPAEHFRTAYPGDDSSRWDAYSGQTPVILQYGSRTRISTQATCDANAFRGTLDQLRALVYPEGGGVSKADVIDALDDTIPFVSEGVRTAATAQGWTRGRSTRAMLEDMWARLVLGQPASTTAGADEQSIASMVLSRLEPEQLADVVVSTLPPDQALRTADLVAARLAASACSDGATADERG